jgi:hypothetical protein
MLPALTNFVRPGNVYVASHQHPSDGFVALKSKFNFDHFAARNFLIMVGTISVGPG